MLSSPEWVAAPWATWDGLETEGDRVYVQLTSGVFTGDTEPAIHVIDLLDPLSPREMARYPTHYGSIAVAGDHLYEALVDSSSSPGIGPHLKITDVADPVDPRTVGVCPLDDDGSLGDVATDGSFAYVGTGSGLAVVDVRDPSALSGIATLDIDWSWIENMVLRDGVLFVLTLTEFFVVDVRDPVNPSLVGSLEMPYNYGQPFDLVVLGDHAYISFAYQGLLVVDISRHDEPAMVGTLLDGYGTAIAGDGDRSYWAYGGFAEPSIRIKEIDPTGRFVEVGRFGVEDQVRTMAAVGGVLYASQDRKIAVIDARDPDQPVAAAAVATDAREIVVRDGLMYVVDRSRRLRIFELSDPLAPQEVSWYETGFGANQLQYGYPLAFQGDQLYIGFDTALVVVDISDPEDPNEIARVSTQATDIAIRRGLAFVAAGEGGLKIFDIGNPAEPVQVGQFLLPGTWRGPNGSATSVAITGRHAVVGTEEQGIRVVDIRDPSQPVEVADFGSGFFYAYIQQVIVYRERVLASEGFLGTAVFDISKCSESHRDQTERVRP
jgi:hypothetical protein